MIHTKSQTIDHPTSFWQRALVLALTAAVIVIADQLTKYMATAVLPLNGSWFPIPEVATYFRITHVTNTGAAFSISPSSGNLFGLIAVLIICGIVYYNYTIPPGYTTFRVALGLQLGGALGNLVDRIRLGHVVDLIDFSFWPAFNVADTALVGGVVIMVCLMMLGRESSKDHL